MTNRITGKEIALDALVVEPPHPIAGEIYLYAHVDRVKAKDSTGAEVEIGVVKALNNVLDVTAPTPAAGDILAWDAVTSKWVAQVPSAEIENAVLVNTTYTVGATGDFATLTAARTFLDSAVVAKGVIVTLLVQAGTVVADQLIFDGVDFSFVKLQCEDALMVVSPTTHVALTGYRPFTMNVDIAPFIAALNHGKAFTIDCGIIINAIKTNGVIFAALRGGQINILGHLTTIRKFVDATRSHVMVAGPGSTVNVINVGAFLAEDTAVHFACLDIFTIISLRMEWGARAELGNFCHFGIKENEITGRMAQSGIFLGLHSKLEGLRVYGYASGASGTALEVSRSVFHAAFSKFYREPITPNTIRVAYILDSDVHGDLMHFTARNCTGNLAYIEHSTLNVKGVWFGSDDNQGIGPLFENCTLTSHSFGTSDIIHHFTFDGGVYDIKEAYSWNTTHEVNATATIKGGADVQMVRAEMSLPIVPAVYVCDVTISEGSKVSANGSVKYSFNLTPNAVTAAGILFM